MRLNQDPLSKRADALHFNPLIDAKAQLQANAIRKGTAKDQMPSFQSVNRRHGINLQADAFREEKAKERMPFPVGKYHIKERHMTSTGLTNLF